MLEALLSAFELNNVPYRLKGANTGRQFVNISCVFCGEDRLHLGINKERGWYKCFVCDARGGWYSLRKKLKEDYPSSAWYEIQPEGMVDYISDERFTEITLPKEKPLFRDIRETETEMFEWLCSVPNDLSDPFRERGFDKVKLETSGVKLGLDKFRGYFVWEQKGFLIGRKYSPLANGPKWKIELQGTTTPIFGYEWARQSSFKRTFITEGVFDCLRFPVGQAVAILGLQTSQEKIASTSEALRASDEIMMVLDREVKSSTIDEWKLNLRDHGFSVLIFDWSSVPDDVKDVDEFALSAPPEEFDAAFGLGITELLI